MDTTSVVSRRSSLRKLQFGLVNIPPRAENARVDRKFVEHWRRLQHLPREWIARIARQAKDLTGFPAPID